MTTRNSPEDAKMPGAHLSEALLIRAIDDELSGSEILLVESHLTGCIECQRRRREALALSSALETAIIAAPVEVGSNDRESFLLKLRAREDKELAPHSAKRFVWRLGWGMALAASLVLGVLLIPQRRQPKAVPVNPVQASLPASIEINGETFVALPYSNPDLPVNTSHIVQMQVPAASLADAGVVLEPVVSHAVPSNQVVIADVLFGIDGQPLGVHVISAE